MPGEPPTPDTKALLDEIAQYRLLCNNVPVAMAYFAHPSNACGYANQGYAQMFGHTEGSILGLTVPQVIGQEAARLIQPQVDRAIQDRVPVSYERQLVDADGLRRHVEVHLLPHMRQPGATPDGAFVLISDITRHRQAEAAVRETEERLAKFMHASEEGIVFHKGGVVTDANPPLLALMGQTLADLVGRPAVDFVAPDMRARVVEVMRAGDEIRYDCAILHRDGTRIPVEFIVRTLHYQGEQLRMTIVRDIRDRLEAQARIHHMAHHDALTGLPNRMAFAERAQALLAQAATAGQALALLFIDLDHFKRINDSLGHPVGDVLLQTVAERIVGTVREADVVARFGGDEFVLLLAGAPTEAAVLHVAGKLLAAIGEPLLVQGVSISVTPSIGVALFPQHGSMPAELVKHADTAMYRAKGGGRARCCIFEPAMAEAVMAELAMESRLAQAVRDDEFVLHYQPQVSLHDGALLGIEALLRWAHPERGLVQPNEFIPLAETRRLILPIGQWVLKEALGAVVRWHAQGLVRVPVAVNLSTQQFQAPGFVESIARALADAGARGSMLELELTERMLMDDLGAVQATLARLKALGVGIAVDDFGTGYSSLGHLRDLPLDRLKIDRSFVKDLPRSAGAAAIARAIVQMGRSLNLEVVAEGVEQPEQSAWLQAQGCDAQQGFAVSPPMPAAVFEDWLRARVSA
jgi:diguanylate cyclase (GGDEF)-like protein/PAS domain S-box-containing protein